MTVSRPWKMRSRRVRSWRPPTSMPTSSPSSASSSHDCSSTARRPSPTRGRPSIWSPRRASGNPEPMDNFVTPRASSAPAPGAIEPLLCLRGIGKCYAAPVLQDVDLDLSPGEVHVLMGANGAGKSTLARIISGLVQPDAGSMMLERSSYRPAGKARAESLRVQIVQQELTLIHTLSVAGNLFLNRLPARLGVVRLGVLRHQARQALAAVGLESLDPMTAAGRLGVGEQQLGEIARALACLCRVPILDEPTAALSSPRVERLCRGERVREVSFELRQGEILGVSGLVGSGRTELLRAIFGADRADSGAVYLEGSDQPRRFHHPRQAIRAGIGMRPSTCRCRPSRSWFQPPRPRRKPGAI